MRSFRLSTWLPLLMWLLTSPSALRAVEEWKGASPPAEISVGALTGLALVDGVAGFAVLGHLGKKLLNRGFVPDINDQVFLEVEGGPILISGVTDVFTGLHLRWDFHHDEDWTFYGLGGVAAVFQSGVQTRVEVNPRLGAGAIWDLWPKISLRAEISHELITAGFQLAL